MDQTGLIIVMSLVAVATGIAGFCVGRMIGAQREIEVLNTSIAQSKIVEAELRQIAKELNPDMERQ